MTDNLHIYEALRTPPQGALKTIGAGRLKGYTDINPQWRLEVMTATFGPCGIGWKFSVDNKWMEPASEGQVAAFADISLYIKLDGEWSDAIPGSGGSMFIDLESRGLYVNNECYKMAVTDALSVAMKQLGVAADVYAGMMDSSKYQRPSEPTAAPVASYDTNNNDNLTISWGKKDGPRYGKTFEQVWAEGPDGHSYLHWVAEDSDLKPVEKQAARRFLDRKKNEQAEPMVMATADQVAAFRVLYEKAGLDLVALGETIRKVEGENGGGVPMVWLKRQQDRVEALIEKTKTDEYADVRYSADDQIGF